jgi:hypothetical protein
MKTQILAVHFFFIFFYQTCYAQTNNNNELCQLVVYEKYLKDTSLARLSEEEASKKMSGMSVNHAYFNESEMTKLVEGISNFENFNSAIILNSNNQKIETKLDLEKCYIHNDKVIIESPKTKEKKIEEVRVNYLTSSSVLKIKFYEKWSFDAPSLKMKKEILAYSIYLCKFMNGIQWADELLFTVFDNNNSLTYLKEKNYFK